MSDRLLAEALRAHDPGALAALYDAHGESLNQYCLFMLHNRDAAQAALRDAFLVADAHIARLGDPGSLRPWLYALSRVECLRRRPPAGAGTDAIMAHPGQRDDDRRLIAWQAVMSLSQLEREALELDTRHGMDPPQIALVLGTRPKDARALLSRGREHLERVLASEVLARRGGHECGGLAAILRGWGGTGALTAPMRGGLLRHADSCPACARCLPRNVSAAKVYGLLPRPEPPRDLRSRMMTSWTDPGHAESRMLAASRAGALNQMGFPAPSAQAARPGRRKIAVSAALAASAAAMVAGAFALGGLGGFPATVGGPSSAPRAEPAQPGVMPGMLPGGDRALAPRAAPSAVPDLGLLLRPGAGAPRPVLVPPGPPRVGKPAPGRTPPSQPPGPSPFGTPGLSPFGPPLGLLGQL